MKIDFKIKKLLFVWDTADNSVEVYIPKKLIDKFTVNSTNNYNTIKNRLKSYSGLND